MKKFTKTTENFVCAHCGQKVIGNGYTNHCPKCLYSMHIDIQPGDRAETCHGLMAPIDYEFKNQAYTLMHKCLKCGALKKNKLSDTDNIDILTQLSERIAKKTFF